MTAAVRGDTRASFDLGPMPAVRAMTTIDERIVRAPMQTIFELARDVDHWPAHLPHYRFVRFRQRAPDGGGTVEMSANRPFGVINWPTWWLSEMQVSSDTPEIRFRHIGGITTGMDVAWTFDRAGDGTLVKLIHMWDGPAWPLVGVVAATTVIGPVFVHGIAARTLEGLALVAEREAGRRIAGGSR